MTQNTIMNMLQIFYLITKQVILIIMLYNEITTIVLDSL
jgi:hypothetical protein